MFIVSVAAGQLGLFIMHRCHALPSLLMHSSVSGNPSLFHNTPCTTDRFTCTHGSAPRHNLAELFACGLRKALGLMGLASIGMWGQWPPSAISTCPYENMLPAGTVDAGPLRRDSRRSHRNCGPLDAADARHGRGAVAGLPRLGRNGDSPRRRGAGRPSRPARGR